MISDLNARLMSANVDSVREKRESDQMIDNNLQASFSKARESDESNDGSKLMSADHLQTKMKTEPSSEESKPEEADQ